MLSLLVLPSSTRKRDALQPEDYINSNNGLVELSAFPTLISKILSMTGIH